MADQITVVVEIGDDSVISVRSNVPGVRVIIADYDVPWEQMDQPDVRVTEGGEDNPWQEVYSASADVDPKAVQAFIDSKPYEPDDEDDED